MSTQKTRHFFLHIILLTDCYYIVLTVGGVPTTPFNKNNVIRLTISYRIKHCFKYTLYC